MIALNINRETFLLTIDLVRSGSCDVFWHQLRRDGNEPWPILFTFSSIRHRFEFTTMHFLRFSVTFVAICKWLNWSIIFSKTCHFDLFNAVRNKHTLNSSSSSIKLIHRFCNSAQNSRKSRFLKCRRFFYPLIIPLIMLNVLSDSTSTRTK